MQLIRTIWNWLFIGIYQSNVFKFLYNECTVYIVHVGEPAVGAFFWSSRNYRPRFMILNYLDSSELKMHIILHETGHLKDLLTRGEKFDKIPKEKMEILAWKYAIKFSDKYGIPLDYEMAISDLKTYNTEYSLLNNRARRKK